MTSAWQLGGLSKGELTRRVWRGINDYDVLGRAAQLAYNFLFAIFPGLLFLTALLGMLAGPGSQLRETLLKYIGTTMPNAAYGLVEKTLQETSRASSGGKLALGLILALWSASAGMAALQDTLNAVYGVKEARPLGNHAAWRSHLRSYAHCWYWLLLRLFFTETRRRTSFPLTWDWGR